eukprot:TRINITY_DN267_c0_g1_i8.p1 TRINITY_DN267_c0_g1~~TRINITY_DN267_c0_g1_i8.p1  ORF type:complete len:217 (-),score=24.61 TRINITY_DN267_c0_g1_i8:93-743(-)
MNNMIDDDESPFDLSNALNVEEDQEQPMDPHTVHHAGETHSSSLSSYLPGGGHSHLDEMLPTDMMGGEEQGILSAAGLLGLEDETLAGSAIAHGHVPAHQREGTQPHKVRHHNDGSRGPIHDRQGRGAADNDILAPTNLAVPVPGTLASDLHSMSSLCLSLSLSLSLSHLLHLPLLTRPLAPPLPISSPGRCNCHSNWMISYFRTCRAYQIITTFR